MIFLTRHNTHPLAAMDTMCFTLPTMPALLLGGDQISRFTADGFLILPPSAALVSSLHDRIFQATTDTMQRLGGDAGNNILPEVLELLAVFEAPEVRGALQSLLGANYLFHSHRRAHLTDSG